MNRDLYFLTIEVTAVIIAGIFYFKTFDSFLKSFKSFLVPQILFLFKPWRKHSEDYFRFEGFIFLIIVVTSINYILFRFVF
jgi:hypothetical protein